MDDVHAFSPELAYQLQLRMAEDFGRAWYDLTEEEREQLRGLGVINCPTCNVSSALNGGYDTGRSYNIQDIELVSVCTTQPPESDADRVIPAHAFCLLVSLLMSILFVQLAIERIDGCDYMVCVCGADFCFLCGGGYTDFDGGTCRCGDEE